MSKFTALDERLHAYLVGSGARQDELLARVEADTAALGRIAEMQIAPDQGAFMTLLARAIGAREILEVGTFTGYSAICLARGLASGGRLTCLELSEEYAEIAAANLDAAGLADRVDIVIGPAAETLASLPDREHFDLVFIDADKVGYPTYYEESLRRLRSNGLLITDNVLQDGRVLDPDPGDKAAIAMAEFNRSLTTDERVDLAMVGIADGLAIVRKR